jgi:hypothetical protein
MVLNQLKGRYRSVATSMGRIRSRAVGVRKGQGLSSTWLPRTVLRNAHFDKEEKLHDTSHI